MSNSLWLPGLQATRFLCSWNFPGKSTGMSCHFLFQRIFLTKSSNLRFLHWGQILYHWATGEAIIHDKSQCSIKNVSNKIPVNNSQIVFNYLSIIDWLLVGAGVGCRVWILWCIRWNKVRWISQYWVVLERLFRIAVRNDVCLCKTSLAVQI